MSSRVFVLCCALGAFTCLIATGCGTMELPGPAGSGGQTGPAGASGPAGPMGADGQLRIYGDGSAGAKTVSANEDWSGIYPMNLQFTDFTVDAGQTLTVPSGTVIRCTGAFSNNGTITVLLGARGGSNRGADTGTIVSYNRPPESGIALAAAVNGDVGSNAGFRLSGDGGIGICSLQARLLLSPGAKAGGGGGTVLITIGADGGGSVSVLAQGKITNGNGASIKADGETTSSDGNGGAGGGVVIFASPASVTNNGSITAKGGAGADSGADAGPGGGGGGGIVHLISPNISQGGGSVITVSGGAAGAIVGMVTDVYRSGGGGGGACRGDGGNGGFVPVGALVTATAGAAGQPGEVLLTMLDPTTLF